MWGSTLGDCRCRSRVVRRVSTCERDRIACCFRIRLGHVQYEATDVQMKMERSPDERMKTWWKYDGIQITRIIEDTMTKMLLLTRRSDATNTRECMQHLTELRLPREYPQHPPWPSQSAQIQQVPSQYSALKRHRIETSKAMSLLFLMPSQ